MNNLYTSRTKVTRCIIQIQGHLTNKRILQFDAYNLCSAVGRYFIGLGSHRDRVTNNWFSPNLELGRPMGRIATSPYPLMRIDENGFKVIKCPTLSGK